MPSSHAGRGQLTALQSTSGQMGQHLPSGTNDCSGRHPSGRPHRTTVQSICSDSSLGFSTHTPQQFRLENSRTSFGPHSTTTAGHWIFLHRGGLRDTGRHLGQHCPRGMKLSSSGSQACAMQAVLSQLFDGVWRTRARRPPSVARPDTANRTQSVSFKIIVFFIHLNRASLCVLVLWRALLSRKHKNCETYTFGASRSDANRRFDW